jgi:hypothetical protein
MRHIGLLGVVLAAFSGCGDGGSEGAGGASGADAGVDAAAGTGGSGGGAEAGTGGAAGASGTGGAGGVGAGGIGGAAGASGAAGAGGFVPEPGERSIIYPANWQPGFETTRPGDGERLFIQDFSYAGFEFGESPLPTGSFAPITTVSATNDGSVDVSSILQDALDDAAASNGGIVLLPAGTYRIDKPITLSGSNVVLRGTGSSDTRLWFKDGGGLSESAALRVTSPTWLSESDQPGWAITAEGAIFDDFVEVQDPGGLAPGDDISIAWDITAEFKQEHGSEAYWYHTEVGDQKTFFRRTVTQIQGNRVYFKVPLRYPVKLRDEPVVRRASTYATRNGIEHLAISTALGSPAASWNSGINGASAIHLRFCKDCWIRDVRSFSHDGNSAHLRSHGITVERSFRVTIMDTHLEKAEHLGGGGNGYLFTLSRSNEVLVRDCSGREGRHNFSINWDFGASGNVFLRILSVGGLVCGSLQAQLDGTCSVGPTDFHHALAVANLFDSSVIDDALQVGNRQDWSTGAGHTGTMNVFWNITGAGHVYAYNQAMGYLVGTGPNIEVSVDLTLPGWTEQYISVGTEPEDFSDFVGTAAVLAPQSLYEEQLARRL